ncbi:MAG: LON peptidase substrate-binding domain-containing protein [Sphaerotilus sp.]|nr:LON peptidase substrate-binding domain-containing protein [Sphaerotilus sp.]
MTGRPAPEPVVRGAFGDLLPHLPLFPLGTVLFPQGLLALKIFETRYLDLITHCLRSGAPFGVVTLAQGAEVRAGEGEVRFEHEGCLAELIDCDSPQAGILQIRCRGLQRFTVSQVHQAPDGLWRADAVLQAADAVEPPRADFQASVTALQRTIDTLGARDQAPFLAPYALDSAGWVANRWCEILPIPLPTRHKLMMLPDPHARLQLVDGFLRRHGIVSD